VEAIINVVAPVFGIILTGYLAGCFKLLGEESSQAINRFVYYISLPVLLFVSMARVEANEILNWNFIGAYLGTVVITLLLALMIGRWVFKLNMSESALFGMGSVFGNAAYMGIPVVLLAYGEAALVPGIIAVMITSVVVVGPISAIVEADQSMGDGWHILKDALAAMFQNPLFIAPMLGITYSLSGLPLPQAVESFCTILGGAAGPSALFALGLSLVGTPIRAGLTEVGSATLLKLAVKPFIMWLLATYVFKLDPLWTMIGVTMAALPSGAIVFVVASRYNVYVQRASAGIVISTLISVFTVSLVIVSRGWVH